MEEVKKRSDKYSKLARVGTAKQQELARLIYERMRTTDRSFRRTTDQQLVAMAGYGKGVPSTDVVKSIGTQLALKKYLDGDEMTEKRLKAKALRNLDKGLDHDDEDKVLSYTQLQIKRESDKERAKMKIDNAGGTINFNMLTMLGQAIED